jgi:bifunctional DNA-binding transcriptional regulator/antitoxin component of YhaV-PrlF toxin-antitoxin module
MVKPVLTKILGRYQVTVPPEIRTLYGLVEGDLLEWNIDPTSSAITIVPKRAQLLTPAVCEMVESVVTQGVEAEKKATQVNKTHRGGVGA